MKGSGNSFTNGLKRPMKPDDQCLGISTLNTARMESRTHLSEPLLPAAVEHQALPVAR